MESGACYLLLFLVIVSISRVLYLIFAIHYGNKELRRHKSHLRTVICVGSGGHTSEMLRIVEKLGTVKYFPRLYIMANNDVNSENKIKKLEEHSNEVEYEISRIPRSRNVLQSYFSSIWTTLKSAMYTIPVVVRFKPEVVLCNGPGTCVPVCVIVFVMRVLFLADSKIIFVESVCRVRSLSLTGKILSIFADLIVVQWPSLKSFRKTKYFGRLA